MADPMAMGIHRRRRRASGDQDRNYGYSEANEQVNLLERRFVAAYLTPRFTVQQIIDLLLPPEYQRILRAAKPLLNNNAHYVPMHMVTVTFPASNEVVDGEAFLEFNVSFSTLPWACPNHDSCLSEPIPAATCGLTDIEQFYLDFLNIHKRFQDVRAAVAYIQARDMTYTAVRSIWPPMLTLLPKHHRLFDISGGRDSGRYKVPDDLGSHLALLRDTQATVVGAQLAPKAPWEETDRALRPPPSPISVCLAAPRRLDTLATTSSLFFELTLQM